MERLVATCEKLNDTRRQLERAIAGIEGPLHIVQECLYHREKRQGQCSGYVSFCNLFFAAEIFYLVLKAPKPHCLGTLWV